jgi:hypothetical protein
MTDGIKDSRPIILDVPRITPCSFVVHHTGNELLVICSQTVPTVDKATGELHTPIAAVAAVLAISPGSAKDLMNLLRNTLEFHEREIGPISTPMDKSSSQFSAFPVVSKFND